LAAAAAPLAAPLFTICLMSIVCVCDAGGSRVDGINGEEVVKSDAWIRRSSNFKRKLRRPVCCLSTDTCLREEVFGRLSAVADVDRLTRVDEVKHQLNKIGIGVARFDQVREVVSNPIQGLNTERKNWLSSQSLLVQKVSLL
jgi:hypothetical protein